MHSVAHFEDISYHIRRTLLSAKYSVKICVAWINGNVYNKIFQELNARGVNIEIIYNNDRINVKTPIIKLDKMLLFPVLPRLSSALMHDKFCIIDKYFALCPQHKRATKTENCQRHSTL